MKVLDLFSGIGGFSIGLERAGFKTVAFCENDTYCKLILKKHWEGVKIYHDVREITRQQYEQDGCELPGIITGGFPCQPFSVAGRRQGTGDNRYLWPEMFRVIKEFKPRWIIAENVRGIINIEDGVVFERVHADLESQDYETQTFIIPAAGVGAPHRRDRVWIVANSRRTIRGEQFSRNKESIRSGTSQETEWSSDSDSLARSSEREKIMADSSSIQSREPSESKGWKDSSRGSIDSRGNKNKRTEVMADSNERNVETGRQRQRGIRKESKRLGISSDASSSSQAMADSSSIQSDVGKINQSKKESGEKRILRSEVGRVSSNVANTNSERRRVWETNRQDAEDVRKSSQGQRHGWWDIEPDVGRVADGVQGRIYRLKGLGNSIVPQIAEEIGQAIMKVELDSD